MERGGGGSEEDIVGMWKQAARKRGLRFGVSEHLSNSFAWMATSHWSDKTGQFAGVPYDGTDAKYSDLITTTKTSRRILRKRSRPWIG